MGGGGGDSQSNVLTLLELMGVKAAMDLGMQCDTIDLVAVPK